MEEAFLKKEIDDLQSDFNKPMLAVFDHDDLKKQQRD